MAVYKNSVLIQVPVAFVSSVLYDPQRQAEIWGAEWAKADDRWPQPGGRIQLVRRFGPVTVDTSLVVASHEPPMHHECRFVEGLLRGPNRFALKDEGGATRFDMECEYTVNLAGLHVGESGLMERVVHRMGGAQVDGALARFKTMVEAELARREPQAA